MLVGISSWFRRVVLAAQPADQVEAVQLLAWR